MTRKPSNNQPWIYSDKVKELFLHPKNYLHGSEQDFNFDAKGTAGNPICGDEMTIYIKVSQNKLGKRGSEQAPLTQFIIKDIKL